MNTQQNTDRHALTGKIMTILAETIPAQKGCAVERLIHISGFPLDIPPSVRIHPDLPFTLGTAEVLGRFEAVVLPFQLGNGQYVGLEVLYLHQGGIAPVLRPWQSHWVSEDCIEGAFFQVNSGAPDDVAVTVGISEALSIWQLCGDATVCAVSDSSDLAAFDWPDGTKHLRIYVNEKFEDAGRMLANRATQCGLAVELLSPVTPGATFFQEIAFADAVPCDQVTIDLTRGSTTNNDDANWQKGD